MNLENDIFSTIIKYNQVELMIEALKKISLKLTDINSKLLQM